MRKYHKKVVFGNNISLEPPAYLNDFCGFSVPMNMLDYDPIYDFT